MSIPIRRVTIKKIENKCWGGRGEIGTLKLEIGNIRLKAELPYGPEIPFLGIYTEKLKAGSQTNIRTSMSIEGLFTIAKRWKQPNCSLTYEHINKIW